MIETVFITSTNRVNNSLVKQPIDVCRLNKTEYNLHGVAETDVTDKFVYFKPMCSCKICYTIAHLDVIKSFCSDFSKSLLLVVDEDYVHDHYMNEIIHNLSFEYTFDACILNKDDNYIFNEYEKNKNFNMFYDREVVEMSSYILTRNAARKIINYFTDNSVYKYILHTPIYDIIKRANILTEVITPKSSPLFNSKIQKYCVDKISNFLKVKVYGSIGKRLFQIATAYSICMELNHILYLEVKEGKEIYDYAYRLFNINNTKNSDVAMLTVEWTDMDKITFKPSVFHNCQYRNVYLKGFFYTEKYFVKYKKNLKGMLKPSPTLVSYFLKTYGELQNVAFLYVAKHSSSKMDLTQTFYYRKAIEDMVSNDVKKFLVFSSRDLSKFSFLDEIDYIQVNENKLSSIQLMSLCGKGGIGSNSACSWWGAWLNDSQVIFPDRWFKNIQETSDLYFDNCRILKVN